MVLCVLLLVVVCVNGKASAMGPACTRHGMAGAIGEEAGDGESQQRLFSLLFGESNCPGRVSVTGIGAEGAASNAITLAHNLQFLVG